MSTHPNTRFLCRRVISVPEENPTETIYEVVAKEDGLGYGFARDEATESKLHIHKEMKEAYIVVKGTGIICLGEKHHNVSPGSVLEILPGTEHHIHDGHDLEIHVYTFPAYDPSDSYPVDKECEIKTY